MLIFHTSWGERDGLPALRGECTPGTRAWGTLPAPLERRQLCESTVFPAWNPGIKGAGNLPEPGAAVGKQLYLCLGGGWAPGELSRKIIWKRSQGRVLGTRCWWGREVVWSLVNEELPWESLWQVRNISNILPAPYFFLLFPAKSQGWWREWKGIFFSLPHSCISPPGAVHEQGSAAHWSCIRLSIFFQKYDLFSFILKIHWSKIIFWVFLSMFPVTGLEEFSAHWGSPRCCETFNQLGTSQLFLCFAFFNGSICSEANKKTFPIMEPSPPWQVSHGSMAQSFPPAIQLC